MLKLGIESGSQAVLDSMDKGTTVEGASRVLRSLHAAGISAFVYLLFGTPAEGPEEAEKTLEFAAARADSIGFFNLAVFNLPRGASSPRHRYRTVLEGAFSVLRFSPSQGMVTARRCGFSSRNGFKRHPALAPLFQRFSRIRVEPRAFLHGGLRGFSRLS
jgi:hypothetical protein